MFEQGRRHVSVTMVAQVSQEGNRPLTELFLPNLSLVELFKYRHQASKQFILVNLNLYDTPGCTLAGPIHYGPRGMVDPCRILGDLA